MRFSLPSSRGAPLALATMLCAGLLGTTAPAQARPAIVVDAIVAPMPPPPLQAELVPAAPFVSAVWVPGRYVRANPGYHWRAHHWELRPGGGWWLRGGAWVR